MRVLCYPIVKPTGDQPPIAKGRFFFLWSLLLLLALSVSGCGGGSPTPPAFVPIRPDPTGTPTGLAARGGPDGRPTSVVSDQVPLSSYTHPSERFHISYPENWQPFDRPNGVVFIDPGSEAGYSVSFSDVGKHYSEEELNQYLVSFVAKNFAGAGTGFNAISQAQQADGSIVAQFSSIDPKLGKAVSEVRVWQKDTMVFVVLINATEAQWNVSHRQLQELANTFTPLNTSPEDKSTPTPPPPEWVVIGPTSNSFAFFYSSDWQVLRQDETSVAVAMPDMEVLFEADMRPWPDESANAAEQAALAYLQELAKDNKNIRNLPPKEFPLANVTGSTIDFLYVRPDGTDMAGSVITGASAGNMYRIVFTSPAKLYQDALQWFNPMYQSFKIIPAEQIVTPGP